MNATTITPLKIVAEVSRYIDRIKEREDLTTEVKSEMLSELKIDLLTLAEYVDE